MDKRVMNYEIITTEFMKHWEARHYDVFKMLCIAHSEIDIIQDLKHLSTRKDLLPIELHVPRTGIIVIDNKRLRIRSSVLDYDSDGNPYTTIATLVEVDIRDIEEAKQGIGKLRDDLNDYE